MLAEAVGWFPQAVHLAVVDPGVGSARRAVMVSAGDSLLAGPDNGLLLPAAERLGGPREAWEITNPALRLQSPSHTFHGRDIFAPAAAHAASGVAPEEFGPPVDPASLVRLPAAAVRITDGGCLGEVVLTDRFGNLQTNLTLDHVSVLGLRPAVRATVRIGRLSRTAVLRASYSEGDPGELLLVEDSHRCLAVCVNRGSAADIFGKPPAGAPVSLTVGGGEQV